MTTNIGVKYELHQVLSLGPQEPLLSLAFPSCSAADSAPLVHSQSLFPLILWASSKKWFDSTWSEGRRV